MKVVVAAVIERESKFLVVRRSPGQKLAGKWEFPGGKVEVGESLQNALARELLEELRIETEIGDTLAESTYHYEHGGIRLVALTARITSGAPSLTVHDDMKWLTPAEIRVLDLAPADVPIVDQLERLRGRL